MWLRSTWKPLAKIGPEWFEVEIQRHRLAVTQEEAVPHGKTSFKFNRARSDSAQMHSYLRLRNRL